MNSYQEALLNLKNIVERSNYLDIIPRVDQDSIWIKHCLVRQDGFYFSVVNLKNKKKYRCETKTGALALAKMFAVKKDSDLFKILHLDKTAGKHQRDCEFYKNAMNTTSNVTKKQVLKTRLEISLDKVEESKRQLNKLIFDRIDK